MARKWIAAAWMLLAPAAPAQLSEKPETWTGLEGHYVREAPPEEVAHLIRVCRLALTRAQTAKKVPPEAAPIMQMADRAMAAGNVNAAHRVLLRVLAILKGRTPGEWLEVASSFTFDLDRRVAVPGAIVHPRAEPLFVLAGPLAGKYTARVTLLAPDGSTAGGKSGPIEKLEAVEFSLPTAGLAPGDYLVRFELLDGQQAVASCLRPLTLAADVRTRLVALREQAEKIALTGVSSRGPRQSTAARTVQYVADRLARALDGSDASLFFRLGPLAATLTEAVAPGPGTDPIHPARDLPYAESLAKELLAGGDPLAARRGDLRLAFAASDKTVQALRLLVPEDYDPAKKWPLAVALHGPGGDEGTWFDRMGTPNPLLEGARKRGYLVLATSGRGFWSFLRGEALADIGEAIGLVTSLYSVDPAQVFLFGNSTGGEAVVPAAIAAPARYAALADIAGVPVNVPDYAKAPDVPLLFVEAGKDPAYSTDEARRHGFLLQRRVKRLEYVSLPAGEDQVAAAAVPAVFDFFDGVRAGGWKPSGRPIPVPSASR